MVPGGCSSVLSSVDSGMAVREGSGFGGCFDNGFCECFVLLFW